MDILARPGVYDQLFTMGDYITREIKAMGERLSIPLMVGGEGPVLQVLFTNEHEIVDYGSMFRADKNKAFIFGIELIKRGVFVSPYEKIYLSTAHTDGHVDRLLEEIKNVLEQVIAKMD